MDLNSLFDLLRSLGIDPDEHYYDSLKFSICTRNYIGVKHFIKLCPDWQDLDEAKNDGDLENTLLGKVLICQKDPKMVKLLVDRNNVNRADFSGRTPIYYTNGWKLRSWNGKKVTKYLISIGAVFDPIAG